MKTQRKVQRGQQEHFLDRIALFVSARILAGFVGVSAHAAPFFVVDCAVIQSSQARAFSNIRIHGDQPPLS